MPRLPFLRTRLAAGVLGAVFANFIALNAHASAGCPGDVNTDHVADIDDLLSVINSWGPCSGCAADITGNNIVGVDDLLLVINGWGTCPCQPQYGCLSASGVWCEDFELVNYSRWTDGYVAETSCESTGFSAAKFVTPTHSHLSEVLCATQDSHRGYGGLRFQGDALVPNFSTPSTGGIDAPNGVIVTFWSWLDVPYTFNSTKWLSLMTVTNDCSNNWANVVTLNIDDSSMKVKPVHVSSVTYANNAPAMPLKQWVRTTMYLNYYTGSMHVWQNGKKVVSATFSPSSNTMCQWHWGLYASGPNDDVTLYEENISIAKLQTALTNFTIEPWFTPGTLPCLSP